MIIALHIAIALLGIICATVGFFRPTTTNLRFSYAFIAMTFGSGFFLVWAEPAQMLRTCISGITYLAVVMVAVAVTKRKLALLQASSV